ncbi:hypothetical protein [Paenibacillus shenyangensis]|uniref:hypothetical protein n=1 Tax=Paenibacillus sp. A9 TaxID=1284352 RepID=UPI00036F993F|nr:hypothetical protein [Paenibacillus sp. A9]
MKTLASFLKEFKASFYAYGQAKSVIADSVMQFNPEQIVQDQNVKTAPRYN